jgi:hypothetical protein
MDDNCQTNGIVFGDWKLVPVDSRNWELCHRHVARATGRHKGGTRPQWNRLGRFYQCNTFDAAIQYAADCELKDGCHDRAMELQNALHEYRAIVDGMSAAVIAAVRGQE